jgi:prepilin-type N-terminal cleavage/methylation domain-containing protein
MGLAPRRASNGGFTLIELVAALAISVVFLTAFLVAYNSGIRSIALLASTQRATGETSDAIDRIAGELEAADPSQVPSVTPDGFTLNFKLNGAQVYYRLWVIDPTIGGDASRSELLQRSSSPTGPWTTLGPSRLIANGHPFRTPYKLFDNSGVTSGPYDNIPPFRANNLSPSIYLVMQTNQEAPVRYVKRTVTLKRQL